MNPDTHPDIRVLRHVARVCSGGLDLLAIALFPLSYLVWSLVSPLWGLAAFTLTIAAGAALGVVTSTLSLGCDVAEKILNE